MEKRTCSTGKRLDRDQVLLMIRTSTVISNVSKTRGSGQRGAGHAFIADAGSSGKTGNRGTPRCARSRGGRGRGGRGGRYKGRWRRKSPTAMLAMETSTELKEATQGVTVVARSATKRCDAPDRCVAFAAERTRSAKICANVVTVFACEADVSGSDGDGGLSGEEQDAFICDAPYKFSDEPGKRGRNALAWQMGDLPVICDNGASCHMSHSSTGMINYREANATMRMASGRRYPIKGYGELRLPSRSSSGEVPLLLRDVGHAPSLSYHLLSMRVTADNGHTRTGNKNSATIKFKTGETLFFRQVGG